MDESNSKTIQTADVLQVSPYLNTELIIHHLLVAAENQQNGLAQDIINDAIFLIETKKCLNNFDAYLLAFDEWISK